MKQNPKYWREVLKVEQITLFVFRSRVQSEIRTTFVMKRRYGFNRTDRLSTANAYCCQFLRERNKKKTILFKPIKSPRFSFGVYSWALIHIQTPSQRFFSHQVWFPWLLSWLFPGIDLFKIPVHYMLALR